MDFDEVLTKAETIDDMKKAKVWMFQEQVRIQARKDELNEQSHKLAVEREAIERERNALKRKIEAENKRFQDNELLVAKKLKIIENAYRQMETDRKALESERLNFEYEKNNYRKQNTTAQIIAFDQYALEDSVFFRGIDNQLALRKRYRELLKIYHPDNSCGDTKTLQRIQKEYEAIKKEYYEI